MKKILKLAVAALFASLALTACKPTLSPTEIPEKDFFAKCTLKVTVTTTIQGNKVNIPNCPVKITPKSIGKSYTFYTSEETMNQGILVHSFPIPKPEGDAIVAGDAYSLSVDFDSGNPLIGHVTGSNTTSVSLDLSKGEKEATKEVTITCYQKK